MCGDCTGQTIVPVRGCGYLYPHEKGKPKKRSTLTEAMQAVHMYKVVFAGHDGRQFDLGVGPVLYRDEILPLLTQDRKVRAGVCNSCLSSGWQAAMKAIASGQMCERPSCAAAPVGRCRCCQAAFCVDHLKQPVGHRPDVAEIGSFRASYYWPIRAPEPSGLCSICYAEQIADTRAAGIEVCDSFAQLERRAGYFSPQRPSYELKERRWLGGDDPLALKRKVQATGERVQQALDLWMQQLTENPAPCRRDWIFDHLDEALPDSVINVYKLILP